ncbi:response regulator transcription factor [Runella slithyformis]|uniref:Two component transcriptional regulator, AraC family n=1 Tax=Runella slithyformis (strain ATCC 29530 / DSM 19594 / LMG 11500 / NCIMB 11436 / LSU 4) TaxID=761193 RepID=A0A7U3ZQX5_RUNSL|nr:response regulator [Runella slithyformis]AEI51730.1 two component transcriptional regulator, AraC family [Runella slithyformis DSM 19594]
MAKILVVEDDDALRTNILEHLTIAGHQIHGSLNGIDALETLHTFTPDIIICDIQMPIMDGIEFLKEKQKDKLYQSIPLIFLTSNVSTNQKLMGLEVGAIDYITKPFQIKELIFKIDNITALRSNLMMLPPPAEPLEDKETIRFKTNLEEILLSLHSNQDFSISEAAFQLNMSVSTFQRHLNRYYGSNFSDLLKLYRLTKAAMMLLKTDKSIEEIAFQSGFNSLSYFSRSFKEVYKIPPIKYRLTNLH